MPEQKKSTIGSIGWVDLTVLDADRVRDFYERVAGLRSEPIAMGDYSDFVMLAPSTSQPTAGICHARGQNAGLPPVWLVYLVVEDLDASIAACLDLGGEIVAPITAQGASARYCVIRDPAGAVVALYQES